MSQAASAPMFPYWKAVAAAVLIHLFFFITVSLSLVTPPQFGVAAGAGGIEISLVAAPAKAAEQEAPKEEEIPPPADPDAMAMEKLDATKVETARTPTHEEGNAASSRSGEIVDVRPDYLRNPAPPYPEAARKAGQAGTVQLKVIIDAKGIPTDVIVKSSSGYRILDETARAHVLKTWRFQPAKVAGVAVKSRVVIPVRFAISK